MRGDSIGSLPDSRSVSLRWVALLALGVAPWTLILFPGGVAAVFPWGFGTLDPFDTLTLTDYLFR